MHYFALSIDWMHFLRQKTVHIVHTSALSIFVCVLFNILIIFYLY